MSESIRKICLAGMGTALFVVLTMCLQVPVFENYYLCLGYIVMAVFCCSVGTGIGTFTGVAGVILYCLLTGGLRGMPGWAAGNVVIGIALGALFGKIRGKAVSAQTVIAAVIVIVLAVGAGILGVKSLVEHLLYAQPFLVRAAKNLYAFAADVFILIVSLPVVRVVDSSVRKMYNTAD